MFPKEGSAKPAMIRTARMPIPTAARILIILFFCLFRFCLAFRLSVSDILWFDRCLATLLL